MPNDTAISEPQKDETKLTFGEKAQTLSTGAAVGAALGTIGSTSLSAPMYGAIVGSAIGSVIPIVGTVIGFVMGLMFANSLSHLPAVKGTKSK